MRVRMIRPAYWTDGDLQTRLTSEQREFYIGLWMLSDDAGYVSWDPERVGAELYPYRSPAWRAKRLRPWLDLLGADHARLLDCGRHVLIPNLTKYQNPPKPSSQNKTAHATCLRQMVPAGPKGDQLAPAQGFSNGGGLVDGLNGGAPPRADDNEITTEFRRLAGTPSFLGGKAS